MDATAAIKIEQYRLRVRFRKLLTCCSDNCRDWWFNHAHHMAFHSLSPMLSPLSQMHSEFMAIKNDIFEYLFDFFYYLISPWTLHFTYMHVSCNCSGWLQIFYGIYLVHRLINHGLNFPQLFLLSCAHQLSRRFIEVDIGWTLLALFVSSLLLISSRVFFHVACLATDFSLEFLSPSK